MNNTAVIFFCLALWAPPTLAGELSITNCAIETEGSIRFSCEVQNGTDMAVAQFRYSAEIYELGRTVPWASGGALVDVPGGIEPGEAIRQTFIAPSIPERARGKTLNIRIGGAVGLDVNGAAVGQPALDTPSELDAIRTSVQACWNASSLSNEALVQVIRIGVEISPDGIPSLGTMHSLKPEAETSAGAEQAYEAARRAILRCGRSGFPSGVRPYPKSLIFTFAPNGLAVAPGNSGG